MNINCFRRKKKSIESQEMILKSVTFQKVIITNLEYGTLGKLYSIPLAEDWEGSLDTATINKSKNNGRTLITDNIVQKSMKQTRNGTQPKEQLGQN
jgi:hypothetical protein